MPRAQRTNLIESSRDLSLTDRSTLSVLSKRRHSFRHSPVLESLEERKLMTVDYTPGGLIFPHAQVVPLFLGSQWRSESNLFVQTGQVNNLLQTLVTGTYMDMLNEYGVGSGSEQPGWIYPVNLPYGTTISDSTIQQEILDEIQKGYYTTSDLIMVYTPPGVVVTTSSGSSAPGSGAFTGYHSVMTDPYTNQYVIYSVVDYPGGPNAALPTMSPFQQISATTSHELAESVTDPLGPIGQPAWIDPQFNPQNGQEIGDIAWGNYGFLDGFLIQAVANVNDEPILPLGSTPIDAVGWSIFGTQGAGISNVVLADFQDPNLAFGERTASNFTVIIDWGDGTENSFGTVEELSPGSFEIIGSHSYSGYGVEKISIQIVDTIDDEGVALNTIGVIQAAPPPPVVVTPPPPVAVTPPPPVVVTSPPPVVVTPPPIVYNAPVQPPPSETFTIQSFGGRFERGRWHGRQIRFGQTHVRWNPRTFPVHFNYGFIHRRFR